ncbi:hypothetical protein OB955_13415 [Halobacteria archaeon AArc-m2/3/4]|uniref:Uncharacterized protein n=1 Tax=Natronoglomus mannanivorans TaxID=2979990 RepID=A0ABT2QFP0_9EURY|nr:hypothetical protein [Halobacteria archaeon AArc-m2/3/4]
MNNAAPALLALLLVFALPMAAVASAETTDTSAETNLKTVAASDPITADNTTNRLSLDGEIRSEHTPVSPDFGTTLATRDVAMQTEYRTYRFEAEFENGTAEERGALVEAEHDWIRERIADLSERERTAVSAHANGTLSDDEFLHTLVLVSAEAAELETHLDTLDSHASIEEKPEEAALDMHQSPVRDRLAAFMSGERSSTRSADTVLIQTTDTGMAISMTGRIEYVSEVSQYSNRDTTAPNQFESFSSAHDHVTALYPWTFGEASTGFEALDLAESQLYGFTVPHEHGELTTYLDGGTGDIFYETQVLRQDQLPIEQYGETWTDGAVELAINRTPANGPIEVKTTEEETGEPVRATVLVDGTIVGETGQSGTLWVSPPQNDYEIAVQTAETTIHANVSAHPVGNER